MLRFERVADQSLSQEDAARAVRLRLTYEERVKSRLATVLPDGSSVAILLQDRKRGTVLRDGSVLVGENGAIAIVEAAAQPVARVSAQDPLQLLRAAYHLANRHVPAQLAPDHMLIERDPVLERMLATLGARIEHLELPFDPEPGAYDGHGHTTLHGDDIDDGSATIGEQLSIAAHRTRALDRSG